MERNLTTTLTPHSFCQFVNQLERALISENVFENPTLFKIKKEIRLILQMNSTLIEFYMIHSIAIIELQGGTNPIKKTDRYHNNS